MTERDLFLKDVGERIINCRKELGLTQEELAEKSELSPQFISLVELGKRSVRVDNLWKVAKALNISINYLLTGVENGDYKSSAYNKFGELTLKQQKAIESIMDEFISLSNK